MISRSHLIRRQLNLAELALLVHGGAGPSIVALAERNLDEVEKTLGSAFQHIGLEFTVRQTNRASERYA
ncbi:MAG TPA: hypothetical protein VK493_10295 [Bryobacteraceae bacterium]|nr:hypothetical protein [Bryobacteraceae bacterium]